MTFIFFKMVETTNQSRCFSHQKIPSSSKNEGFSPRRTMNCVGLPPMMGTDLLRGDLMTNDWDVFFETMNLRYHGEISSRFKPNKSTIEPMSISTIFHHDHGINNSINNRNWNHSININSRTIIRNQQI